MKRPVVWLISAFICGIILYFYFSAGLLIAMLGGCLYTLFAYRKPVYLLLIPALLSGVIPCAVFNRTKLDKPEKFDGRTVKISFTVTEVFPNGKYKIQTDKINGEGFKTEGYLYSKDSDYALFDTADASASFNAVKNFSKRNSFDYKTYLINRGVFFTAYQYGEGSKTGSSVPKITGKIALFRQKVLDRTKKISSFKNYGVFAAILTGDKTSLSSHTKDSFRKLGISHLLAVSGLHISIILGILSSILGIFRIKRLPKAIICTLFLLAAIPFMNSSPSVTRAAVMGIILLWSDIVRADNDSVTSMSIAAFVILVFRPYSVFDAGCILSFTATAGIVLLSPIIEEFFIKHFNSPHPCISVMLAAQTAIIPANIYYCGEFSYISFLTNLIFVPVFPVLVVLLISACVLPFVAPVLNAAADIYLGAAEQISRLPNIISETGAADPLLVLSAVPVFLFFMFGKRMKILFGLIALIFLSASGINLYNNMNYSHIYLVAADKTKAAVVKAPEKSVMIAECGIDKGSDYDIENIRAYLDGKGIKKINEVYFLGNPENAVHFKKDLRIEYDPDFPQKCETDLGGGIKLSENKTGIIVSGDKTVAAFADMFTEDEPCQAAYEFATSTLSTVFDTENRLSAKNKNVDITFDKNGVRKMKIDD